MPYVDYFGTEINRGSSMKIAKDLIQMGLIEPNLRDAKTEDELTAASMPKPDARSNEVSYIIKKLQKEAAKMKALNAVQFSSSLVDKINVVMTNERRLKNANK